MNGNIVEYVPSQTVMLEQRPKRLSVRTDKAASKLAGRPVAVFKPHNKKPSRQQARSSATDVLSEAVHAAEADGAAASASQAKPRKQPVKSTKKLAKKESKARKARRAAAGAGVAAAGSGRYVQFCVPKGSGKQCCSMSAEWRFGECRQ